MEFKTIKEFKDALRKAIKYPDMEKFKNLSNPLSSCPFPVFNQAHNQLPGLPCPSCPLSDNNGPREFTDPRETCLLGGMTKIYRDYIYRDHYDSIIDETKALAELVLIGIKLLAYLDSKSSEE